MRACLIARHRSANLPDRLVCYRHLSTSLSKSGRGTAFAEARRVSLREAERVFARPLTENEHDLLAAFREELDASRRGAFWRLYEELRSGPPASPDLKRTRALRHLKAAGAVGFPAAVAEAGRSREDLARAIPSTGSPSASRSSRKCPKEERLPSRPPFKFPALRAAEFSVRRPEFAAP